MADIKLHLGCGSLVAEGWVNVDYSPGARVSRLPVIGKLAKRLGVFGFDWAASNIVIHDLRKPLPWGDSSVSAIYTSHTLEHLTRQEGLALLRECWRVLEPGGLMRIVVPDLRSIVDAYTSGKLPGEHFLEELHVLYAAGKSGLRAKLAPLVEFPHRCMYDHASLLRTMRAAGFDCDTAAAFESGIPGIDAVEHPERVMQAVIVEGAKSAERAQQDVA